MNVSIIVQYSEGIGHLARISAIADSLKKFAKVKVFSGGRKIDFPINEDIDFIQLPEMYWDRGIEAGLKPVDKTRNIDECLAERSKILVEHYRAEIPDILITEYYPFTPGFLGNTLDGLFCEIDLSNPKPSIFCSIRTFPKITYIDSNTEPDWINDRLKKYYSGVLHHADSEIFPVPSLGAYINKSLCGVKYYQTGFVRKRINNPPNVECKGLLFTIGGGNARNASLLKKWIQASEKLPKDLYPIKVVCGQLMSDEDKIDIKKIIHEGIIFYDHVKNMDHLMQESRAIVCMGGYNTLVEALSLKKPILSFPTDAYGDQDFQVQRFFERGLLIKGNVNWSVEEIANEIERLSEFTPSNSIDFNGAEKTAKILFNESKFRI